MKEKYINADAFAESLRQFCEDAHWGIAEQKFSVDQIIGALEMHPTVDVREVVHGKWLSHYDYCEKHGYIPSGLTVFWWCDQCEQGVEHPTNFCPTCGADMRGVE